MPRGSDFPNNLCFHWSDAIFTPGSPAVFWAGSFHTKLVRALLPLRNSYMRISQKSALLNDHKLKASERQKAMSSWLKKKKLLHSSAKICEYIPPAQLLWFLEDIFRKERVKPCTSSVIPGWIQGFIPRLRLAGFRAVISRADQDNAISSLGCEYACLNKLNSFHSDKKISEENWRSKRFIP